MNIIIHVSFVCAVSQRMNGINSRGWARVEDHVYSCAVVEEAVENLVDVTEW